MRLVVVLVAVVAAAVALPSHVPEPGRPAAVLEEDDLEDYPDALLEIEEAKWVNSSSTRVKRDNQGGCTFNINKDLGQRQPVYIHRDEYLRPVAIKGEIRLNTGEQVTVACTGSGKIQHPNIVPSVTTAVVKATCENKNRVSGAGWLNGIRTFGKLTCSERPTPVAELTNIRCFEKKYFIRVGYKVNEKFYTLYDSCFNKERLEVLYVRYSQTPENAMHQTVDSKKWTWSAGGFFPNINVDTMYSPNKQRTTIAQLVGKDRVDKYVTRSEFLTRGHLAARSDFVFATGQKSTYHFINAAPQWQGLNSKDWSDLEQGLRARIAEKRYNTVIYTGTFGVCQLRNASDHLVDIYLVDKHNQIPVPLYFYKVAYDEGKQLGTAFISVNNPYATTTYNKDELRKLVFCKNRCSGKSDFAWLSSRWQTNRSGTYNFCCEVKDFRNTVPHLPAFNVKGLLI